MDIKVVLALERNDMLDTTTIVDFMNLFVTLVIMSTITHICGEDESRRSLISARHWPPGSCLPPIVGPCLQ